MIINELMSTDSFAYASAMPSSKSGPRAVAAAFIMCVLAGCSAQESTPKAAMPTRAGVGTTSVTSSASSPDKAAARCSRDTLAVLSAAISDVVRRGRIGNDYARATRRYGTQSDAWRLASLTFPPVYAQLQAQGQRAARAIARTLAKDGCRRLDGNSIGSAQSPDLTAVEPIRVSATEEPTPQTTAPVAARSCYVLEDPVTAFSGNWLRADTRSAFPDETMQVQSQLNWLGYGCIAEDGDYGPVTAQTVRRFQRDYGLVVDGIVGPETWNALFQLALVNSLAKPSTHEPRSTGPAQSAAAAAPTSTYASPRPPLLVAPSASAFASSAPTCQASDWARRGRRQAIPRLSR